MSKWHYQVMKHSDDRYAIHEYYVMNNASSWEKQPTRIDGDSVEDIKKMFVAQKDKVVNDIAEKEVEETIEKLSV